jgi:hypothetical protein
MPGLNWCLAKQPSPPAGSNGVSKTWKHVFASVEAFGVKLNVKARGGSSYVPLGRSNSAPNTCTRGKSLNLYYATRWRARRPTTPYEGRAHIPLTKWPHIAI